MDILNLWDHLVNVGYIVRKNGYDGLKMWQPFKDMYSKCNTLIFDVNDNVIKLSQELKYTPHDTNHENATIKIHHTLFINSKDTDHFIIQHFRIPIMLDYKLSLVKLLQIAYNVGQAKGEFEKGTYNDEIVDYYQNNKLCELPTFIYRINLKMSWFPFIIIIFNLLLYNQYLPRMWKHFVVFIVY